jgi:membrane-bound ClpP family serine protease
MTRPMTTTLVLTGAALTVVGGIIGLAGATVTTIGAAVAARRRLDQMEVPPSELARRHWHRARTAVNAGAGAWRNNEATPVP